MSIETAKIHELMEIMDELAELERRVSSILEQADPAGLNHLNAYGALNFGYSSNPNDTTLAQTIDCYLSGDGGSK